MSEPRTKFRARVVLALALLLVLGLAGAATRLQSAPAGPQRAAQSADPDQASIPRAPYSVGGSSLTVRAPFALIRKPCGNVRMREELDRMLADVERLATSN